MDLPVQNNQYLILALGGCNPRSKDRHEDDKTSFEGGNAIEYLFSQLGLHQIINNATHLLTFTYYLCIDLVWYI